MSFSHVIKKEILSKEYSKEEALDFISGILASSENLEKDKYLVRSNKTELSQLLKDLFNQLKISFTKSPENKNWIIIKKFEPNHNIKHPNNFFAGIFVGCGSISDPSSTSYHLELQFIDKELSQKVKTYLNRYGFNFSEIKRRKNWVLYLKKSEMLTDFLRVIQAYDSLLNFEEERITRDFRNQLNRYSNLDVYNQSKLAAASSEFSDRYSFVIKNKLLGEFNEKELAFFKVKKDNPYLSLADLTKKFFANTGIKKTRAGLNHYIYKLKKISTENGFK